METSDRKGSTKHASDRPRREGANARSARGLDSIAASGYPGAMGIAPLALAAAVVLAACSGGGHAGADAGLASDVPATPASPASPPSPASQPSARGGSIGPPIEAHLRSDATLRPEAPGGWAEVAWDLAIPSPGRIALELVDGDAAAPVDVAPERVVARREAAVDGVTPVAVRLRFRVAADGQSGELALEVPGSFASQPIAAAHLPPAGAVVAGHALGTPGRWEPVQATPMVELGQWRWSVPDAAAASPGAGGGPTWRLRLGYQPAARAAP